MNKSHFTFGIIGCILAFTACHQPADIAEAETLQTEEIVADTTTQCVPADTLKKFASEPGLFKMIRENYLDIMKEDHSFLVIPVVSGCNCGLVSFESLDSQFTAFKTGIEAQTYWLLKGKDEKYSSKIAKNYPGDIEMTQPKRAFQEYGLFQSSTLVFELRNNSEIVRWISISR